VLTWLLLTGGLTLVAASALGVDPNAIVVQVGEHKVSVSELERRWQALPAFQRRALGTSAQSRLRTFIDRWVVPELLLVQSPRAPDIRTSSRVQTAQQSILQQALADDLRSRTEKQTPVTDGDVKAYFEAHRDLFDKPERLRLFRILLADQKDAEELIGKLKNAPAFDTWRNLAREKSLDRATSMRAGELGFVSADGKSDIVELQVNPALFAVAARLKDGEMTKQPINEGNKFAILWRRGHIAAEPATLAAHETAIFEHLRQARDQAALGALVSELKTKFVRDQRPEALEGVTFSADSNK
jgi:peptidyl-prolyl cis-trans isomerase C